MRKILGFLAVALLVAAHPAQAVPGLDSQVYGAVIAPDMTEFETRYGTLTGGSEAGTSATVFEASHGFSNRFYGALLLGLDRAPREPVQVSSVAVEGIYYIGNALGLDFAAYGEVAVPVNGERVNWEVKALVQKLAGNWDLRLNLIAETPFGPNPVEFGYAASVDYAVWRDDVKLGVEAFGDFGTSDRFGGRQEAFVGPMAKFEVHLPPSIGGEIEMQAAYLFAAGAAKDIADAQVKLIVAWEKRF